MFWTLLLLLCGCHTSTEPTDDRVITPRPLPSVFVCPCYEACDDGSPGVDTIQQVVCGSTEATAVATAERFCALGVTCGACVCSCRGPYVCE